MCNNNDIEDEYHFILECSKYVEIRRKYIKPYYCINPSAFKLTQLLSVQNIKELNKYFKTDFSLPMIKNLFFFLPRVISVMLSKQLHNYHLHNIKYLTCTYENTKKLCNNTLFQKQCQKKVILQ
jgi:hypothetical protein